MAIKKEEELSFRITWNRHLPENIHSDLSSVIRISSSVFSVLSVANALGK
jgi:hypothetical protein